MAFQNQLLFLISNYLLEEKEKINLLREEEQTI